MFVVLDVVCLFLPTLFFAALQNGRDGGTAAAERARRFVGFIGRAVNRGDGGESQRSPRHPRNVIQASGLLIAGGWSRVFTRHLGGFREGFMIRIFDGRCVGSVLVVPGGQ